MFFYLLPSADPAVLRAGRNPSPAADRPHPPRARARQALYVQYFGYMKGIVLHFDFGYSYYNGASVRA